VPTNNRVFWPDLTFQKLAKIDKNWPKFAFFEKWIFFVPTNNRFWPEKVGFGQKKSGQNWLFFVGTNISKVDEKREKR